LFKNNSWQLGKHSWQNAVGSGQLNKKAFALAIEILKSQKKLPTANCQLVYKFLIRQRS